MTDYKKMLKEGGLPTEEAQIRQEFVKLTNEEGLITNTSSMSPFWRLISAIAITPVKWLTDNLINEVLPNLFVKTAKDSWLQVQAWQVGLDFKPATKAQGVVHFTKQSAATDLTIKAGTVIQTERINNVIYRVIVDEDTLIQAGQLTGAVNVTAEEVGTAYNLAAGYYRILPEPIAGVAGAENLEDWLLTVGADKETNDELRQRYRAQFSSVGQFHIDSVYKSMIAQVAGLSIDRIYFKHDAPRGAGTANAYLLLDTGIASQPFVDKVNRYINDEGNHGHGDGLLCFAMPETKHAIKCEIYFDPTVFIGTARRAEILQQVEQMIRSAFRENKNYNVSRVYPFARFSWSKLGDEIHDQFDEIASIVWGQADIVSDLNIPRISTLEVSAL